MNAAFWLALLGTAAWLGWYLRRCQLYWDAGESQIMQLGTSLRQIQRAVADEERNYEKLAHDIKMAQNQAKTAQRDAQELHQKRRSIAPPPPVEILVASEFPSSASEEPWIAHMVQRFGNLPEGQTERPVTPVLFWAAGHKAAMARARHIAGDLQLAVNDIRRLTPAKD